jgi:hypothetical protein
MPDANNVEQIISFQKKMYEMVKHMLPPPQVHPEPSPISNFSPFPGCPDRGFRMESEFFPAMQNYVPSFGARSFASSNHSFDDGRFKPLVSMNKSEPVLDRSPILKVPLQPLSPKAAATSTWRFSGPTWSQPSASTACEKAGRAWPIGTLPSEMAQAVSGLPKN